ncbi:MAG: hypothetical protein H0W08_23595 [Acidobacteria bacterium]|nr:hypothetical protein [Acidobacteriota bacterium]
MKKKVKRPRAEPNHASSRRPAIYSWPDNEKPLMVAVELLPQKPIKPVMVAVELLPQKPIKPVKVFVRLLPPT